MVANMDYYRAVRREDPSYSAYDAFKEWMRDNPDVAVEFAEKIWPEYDPDTFPMDWDALNDHLKSKDPIDVFFDGYYSHPNVNYSDKYFVMDGYDHITSISDRKYEQMCVAFMCGWGYEEIAFDDKYPAPKELADVLALWGMIVRTENRRPTSTRKGGSCGRQAPKKAPSKNSKSRSSNAKSAGTKSRSVKAKPKTGRR